MEREKIISGKAKIAKKNGLSRAVDAFIEEDFKTVRNNAIKENIVPGIKEVLANTLTDMINMLLFGETRGHTRGAKRTSNGGIIYESIFNSARKTSTDSGRKSRKRLFYEDVHFQDKEDAKDVLRELAESFADGYDSVSVLDLYSSAGIETEFTNDDYGWEDISGARIEYDPSNEECPWVLRMPKPTYIK